MAVLPTSKASHSDVGGLVGSVPSHGKQASESLHRGDLRIARCTAQNGRNYHHLHLDLSPGWTALVGPNGAGKTNALELLLVSLRNFVIRGTRADLIYDEALEATIVTFLANGDTVSLNIVRREESVTSRRLFNGGGERPPDGRLPSIVVFLPEDDALLQHADGRRRLLGRALLLQSWRYTAAASTVHRLLHQRTHALRRAVAGERRLWEAQGTIWTEALILPVLCMWVERLAYVEYVNTHLTDLLERLGGMTHSLALRLRFGGMEERKTIPSPEEIAEAFHRTRSSEEILGRTLIGPHRDGVDVLVDGHRGLHRLSRGQRRLLLLALHLLEGERVRTESTQGVLYAFDDVLSELDDAHRREVGAVLGDRQVIFTTADPHMLTFLPTARVYMVNSGVATLSGEQRETIDSRAPVGVLEEWSR